ncbi:tubulin-folding cofactor C isoform X3 [Rhododendron vialii]|uniref:tubulin-folding cofactor C isoform X3 n=1 Tax=Rhododendron vialii TaxID=182163 RepID=UPI00265F5C23|nr:tubulin-folding cofactor C isoform X3 [Rhododendron vialii]
MEGEEEGNQASTETLDDPPAPALAPAAHPKHAAMLERLSNRHLQSLSRQPDPTSLDSTHSFLSLFSQSKLSIESNISLLRRQSTDQTNPALKSNLEKISTSISHLEKLVAENSYSLPSFEVRTCLEAVSSLKQTLDTLASDIVPKKRFSFRNKKDPSSVVNAIESGKTEFHGSGEPSCTVGVLLGFKDREKKAPSSVVNVIESESRVTELEEKPSFRVWDSPGFKDRENEVLVREFNGLEMGEFSLTGLSSCEVRLTGCLRALFVHKLRDCKVYVGPVFGSVLIEEVEGCVFVLASHQIRIHRARGSDFYLRVRSRPIIEDCSGVRFAPYCLGYDGIERDLKESNLDEETGNWANVDDFRWLKAAQSPNWSILPESEWIGRVTIDVVPMLALDS